MIPRVIPRHHKSIARPRLRRQKEYLEAEVARQTEALRQQSEELKAIHGGLLRIQAVSYATKSQFGSTIQIFVAWV